MIRQPPGSKRTDTLFPSTTLFRSQVDALLQRVSNTASHRVEIDLLAGSVAAADGWTSSFQLSARHRDMFAHGQDMVGASLQQLDEIARYEAGHWGRHPWMRDVARRVRARLDAAD